MGPKVNVPKVPSVEKKVEPVNRISSQNKAVSSSLNKAVGSKGGSLSKDANAKKDSAK
jgi:hypothetical protein